MDEERNPDQAEEAPDTEEELLCRRDFLLGLKKWSKVAIAAALAGGALAASSKESDAGSAGWINRGDGGRAWVNGGGGWVNRYGGGGSWGNRYGGGGGGWVNRYGGGGAGWINR